MWEEVVDHSLQLASRAKDIQGLLYQLLLHNWHIITEMHMCREKPAMFEMCNFGLTNNDITELWFIWTAMNLGNFANYIHCSFAQNVFLRNHNGDCSITQGPQILALALNHTPDYLHGRWEGRLAQFWNQGPDAEQAVGCCSGRWAESAPRGHDDSSKSPSPAFQPPNFSLPDNKGFVIFHLPWISWGLVPKVVSFAAFGQRDCPRSPLLVL